MLKPLLLCAATVSGFFLATLAAAGFAQDTPSGDPAFLPEGATLEKIVGGD
jgi:hypothetical protein